MEVLLFFKTWFVDNVNIEIVIPFMTFRATMTVLGINILYDVSEHRDLIKI